MNDLANLKGIGMTSQRTRERLIRRLREEGIRSEQVLDAIRNTPRHLFVDEALSSRAYEDTALPIGMGQTISQPYIVARMTELVLQSDTKRILEVGTGCGYQTAVLAQLVEKVYTVERINALLLQARKRFRTLKLTNIRSRHGDGYAGWPEYEPFDGIIVTAAPPELPKALLQQLNIGARLVLPIGGSGIQRLSTVTRTQDGFEQVNYEHVSFVPLVTGRI